MRSDSRRSARPPSHPAHRTSFACRRPTARGRSGCSAGCRISRPATTDTSRSSSAMLERHAFARGGGEDQPVDRAGGVVADQPPQRGLVEFAVAKRRHQRQPQALQQVSSIQSWSISLGVSRRRDQQKTPSRRRGFGIAWLPEFQRARSPVPGRGPFFETRAHEFVIMAAMMGPHAMACQRNRGSHCQCTAKWRKRTKKSRAQESPA